MLLKYKIILLQAPLLLGTKWHGMAPPPPFSTHYHLTSFCCKIFDCFTFFLLFTKQACSFFCCLQTRIVYLWSLLAFSGNCSLYVSKLSGPFPYVLKPVANRSCWNMFRPEMDLLYQNYSFFLFRYKHFTKPIKREKMKA